MLFFVFGAAHQLKADYLDPNSHLFQMRTAHGFFLYAACVEATWILWDISYLVQAYVSLDGSLRTKFSKLWTTKSELVGSTWRWTLLNVTWAGGFIAAVHQFDSSTETMPGRVLLAFAGLIAFYLLTYMLLQRKYYAGEIYDQSTLTVEDVH